MKNISDARKLYRELTHLHLWQVWLTARIGRMQRLLFVKTFNEPDG